ncbi:MAG TPA: VOC family protein [Gemmatimonadaceae bacterium]
MTYPSQHTTTLDERDGTQVGIVAPAHRLSAGLRLGQVRLQVADLGRSLDYYQNVLGFRVVSRTPTSASLAALGDDTPVIQLEERRGAAPVPHQGRLGLYHFAILVPDRGSLGRFIGHLMEIGARAGASDHLVSEALYLRDPDGLGIEVYADRPRSSWRTANRQIRMDTTPLDLNSLVEAGGEAPWLGMPFGTAVGHVHLHVGDLDQASDFYHTGLGLDKIVWSYPGALFLSSGGYHHHLGVNTWAGAGAPRAGDDDARLLDWRIELPHVDDVNATIASLQAAGYPAVATQDGWRVTDPWGTSLVLATRRS